MQPGIYRVVFSVYTAGGAALLCFLTAFFNPRIYEKIEIARQEYIQAGQIPPEGLIFQGGGHVPPAYPLGYYIAIFALLLVPLVYFSPWILTKVKIGDRPLARCVFIVALFTIFGGLAQLNFGVAFAYYILMLGYGVCFGLIDGVHASRLDLAFIHNRRISQVVRVAKLQSEYDKWFRGLTLFTTFFVAVAVVGTLQLIITGPSVAASENVINYGAMAVYIGVGIGIGLFWDVITKVNQISASFLEIVPDTPQEDMCVVAED